jgi:ABC-type multidrug transport system fused ATPase/permease subunit
MFTNPFATLPDALMSGAMQAYVILMVLLVIGGVLIDITHKKSAKYFFEKGQALKKIAKREVTSAEKSSIAISTLTHEVLASGEFENPDRRKSHLLMMYGFIVFVVTTALLIFGGSEGISLTSLLWHAGAISLAAGGYWFWFKIRADVRSEGNEWNNVHQSDMFIVSLLAMSTLGLIWSLLAPAQMGAGDVLAWIAFAAFIAATTFLFSTVVWSKFAHMFFKPAAAYAKKVSLADGSRDKLPEIPDLASAECKERYPDIPEYMGDNPPNMGLGIKREAPTHY